MKRFYFFVGVALSLLLFCPAHAQDSAEPDGSSPIPHGALTDPEDMVKRGRMAAYFDANNLALPPVVGGVSAILMDADNRQILWEQNADARREPASTTKILTALLFVEATKPQEIITCNDPSLEKLDESLMHIPAGEKFTADNLLNGVMVRSANDGAVLMAERVAGTVPKFAEKMNARAKQLGAFNSQFVTPNGLHDPRHYSTARDIALIACAALKNPRFAEAVRLPERIIQRSIRKNNVLFIAKSASKFHQLMPEADGVKSGYTRQAGHCFVGSATREGRRLLVVVLGSPNAVTDSVAVLNWGFARFPVTFFARKGEVVARIACAMANRKRFPPLPSTICTSPPTAWIKRDALRREQSCARRPHCSPR